MRPLLLMLLLASATFGGVAYGLSAVHAASEPPFALSVTPSTQMAARGGSVSFSADVRRSNGFTGPVRLSLGAVPAGIRPRWQLDAGAVSSGPALVLDGATLTLRISTRTPLGTRRVTLRATGDGQTLRRSLWLTVTRAGRLSFAVTVTPARQVVPRGSAARYNVQVLRSGGPELPISLRTFEVPDGEHATFSGRTLTVATSAAQKTGTHRLVIAATTWIRGRRVHRFAVVTLSVVEPRRLAIRGDLPTPLFPGARAALDPIITNPQDFDVRVVALHVQLRADTSRAACSGASQYTVRQYAGPYPLVLGPGSTRLSAIVPDASSLPWISMHDLPTNQDACKGAVLSFDYSALATR